MCVFDDLDEKEEVDCFRECPVQFICDSIPTNSQLPEMMIDIIRDVVAVALKHERNHEIDIAE